MKHFYYFVPCRNCEIALLLRYIGHLDDDTQIESEIVPSQTLTLTCPRCDREDRYHIADVKVGAATFCPPEHWNDVLQINRKEA